MKFSNPYFTDMDKINLLERWILVHSYLYYEINNNIVSDTKYDSNCKELVKLFKSNVGYRRASRYGYAFEGYDASTGFDLFTKLKQHDKIKIQSDAELLLRIVKRKGV